MKHVKTQPGAAVSVLGAARSGLTVARLLERKGYRVFVSEAAPQTQKRAAWQQLSELGIEAEFGGHTARVLQADFLVVSPGISPELPLLKEARRRGLPAYGELEVASWFCPGPLIAVTGTNGKSTTTAWLGEMFQQAGRKHVVAGNIGWPLADCVFEIDAETTAVLEVSSYQLQLTDTFRPGIAVLLNVTPDHLERHGTLQHYAQTKLKLCRNQSPDHFVVFNAADPLLAGRLATPEVRARRVPFHSERPLSPGCGVQKGRLVFNHESRTVELVEVSRLALPGRHNLENALAAAAAALLAGLPESAVRQALTHFNGLEHRLEFVRELDGVRYINDSKATNLDALLAALNSFRQPVVLIAGGQDKGDDVRRIAHTVAARVKQLVLFGESAPRFETHFSNVVPCRSVRDLAEAVHAAHASARAGDVVLLSPGCASFDQFRDFEARGRRFKQLVHQLRSKP